ncbi:MAG TPA: hypothetical protein PK349_12880 [Candidatus Hydrogenedentes bacterium]|nr:hypothetical protein [Candidatus Hydrogenedentota bacterium]
MVVTPGSDASMPAPRLPRFTNAVRLWTCVDGAWVSHFTLREFANPAGLCVVHPCLLESLERTRADLSRQYGHEVLLLITDATRTPEDNQRLAARLGWTDQGGWVARDSRHLAHYGGIAVDLRARLASGEPVPPDRLAGVCRKHFDYVRAGYPDGHVHADNRARAASWSPPPLPAHGPSGSGPCPTR